MEANSHDGNDLLLVQLNDDGCVSTITRPAFVFVDTTRSVKLLFVILAKA